jgi:AcrR family transcriptional regulator
MATPEPLPLRADAERNRRRLLDAAREVFATQGLDVTLDEIARVAGVGTGTAYRRFPNKDALIEELMVERLGELVVLAEESLAEPDPWTGLTSYLERALALQCTDRGLKDILFSSGRGREALLKARQKLAPVVAKLVKRAVDAGAVRSDMATSDVPLINLMLATVIDVGRGIEPELYQRYLGIVLDGLRPQRDAPTPLPAEALGIPELQQALAAYRT